MSGLVRVSPSQIAEAMDPETGCWRRWGWKHIEKIRPTQSPQQKFGDDAHKEHELWFASQGQRVHDLNTSHGKAAYAGLKWLPLPGPYVLPEGWMEFDYDGVKAIGKVDLHFVGTPSMMHALHFSERALSVPEGARHLVITDYKFTSDLKWRKTGDRLLQDPQRVMYATWAVLKYQPDFVTTRWLYHRRSKPYKAEPSDFTEHRDEVLQHYPFVHEQALRIKANKRKKIHELEMNTRACRAFNRDCDYLSRCFPNGAPTVDQHLTSMFAQVDATLERAYEQKERTMSDQVFAALGIQPPQAQPNGAPNGAPQGGWGPPQGAPQQSAPPQQQNMQWGPPQGGAPQGGAPQGQPQWGPPAQQSAPPQGQPQWGPPAQTQQTQQPAPQQQQSAPPQQQAPQGQPQWGPPAQGGGQQPPWQGQQQSAPPQQQAPQGGQPQWAPPQQETTTPTTTRKKKGDEITLRGLMYAAAIMTNKTFDDAERWIAQVKAADKADKG